MLIFFGLEKLERTELVLDARQCPKNCLFLAGFLPATARISLEICGSKMIFFSAVGIEALACEYTYSLSGTKISLKNRQPFVSLENFTWETPYN